MNLLGGEEGEFCHHNIDVNTISMTDGYHESLLYAYHFNINVRHHFIDNCQIYIVIYISITIFNISAPITMIAYRLTYRYHVVCANRYHSFFKNNVSHLSSHNTSLCFPVNHGIVGSASLKNATFGYQVSAHYLMLTCYHEIEDDIQPCSRFMEVS